MSKPTVVYSQPADTGVGQHWGTQLLFAVDFLKKHVLPIRLEDLAIRSQVETLLTNPSLFEAFKKHDRVLYDEKTGLFSYRPDFILRSKADLYHLAKQYAPKGGLSVKTLRESWAGVGPAIEELEKEHKILVTRTGAGDGQMKAIFYDEIGPITPIDDEFKALWATLKTPPAAELADALREAGLNTMTAKPQNAVIIKKKKGKKGPGSYRRRLKITNTHLKDQGIDLSKDYTPVK